MNKKEVAACKRKFVGNGKNPILNEFARGIDFSKVMSVKINTKKGNCK